MDGMGIGIASGAGAGAIGGATGVAGAGIKGVLLPFMGGVAAI